jgi:hypothetical protein
MDNMSCSASLLTIVFVKSPPSDRAAELFDPEEPKPIRQI